ncbi:MAG: hypothetical protein FJ144_00095 [Deltaproteobacteria bacterium]|nr:hypothetical protein [Deltaproteobacteria bacterium]
MRPALAILALLTSANVAGALDYTCPSDPGFCYFDVAGDGCFDAGTDTGPIDADLEAGTYPPVGPPSPGSIVCPPNADTLNVPAPIDWETANGGSILLHKTRVITTDPITMSSGAALFVGGKVTGFAATLQAEGDLTIAGSVILPKLGTSEIRLTTVSGELVLGPRSKVQGFDIEIEAQNGGPITVLDKATVDDAPAGSEVSLRTEFTTTGPVTMTNPRIRSGPGFRFNVGSLEVLGAMDLQTRGAAGGPSEINSSGAIEIDAVKWKLGGDAETVVSAPSIEIGRPDSSGRVRTSKITLVGMLEIESTGELDLERVKLVASGFANVSLALEAGTDLAIREGVFASKRVLAPLTISSGPGGTCDLTDTDIVGFDLMTSCGTIVGP